MFLKVVILICDWKIWKNIFFLLKDFYSSSQNKITWNIAIGYNSRNWIPPTCRKLKSEEEVLTNKSPKYHQRWPIKFWLFLSWSFFFPNYKRRWLKFKSKGTPRKCWQHKITTPQTRQHVDSNIVLNNCWPTCWPVHAHLDWSVPYTEFLWGWCFYEQLRHIY